MAIANSTPPQENNPQDRPDADEHSQQDNYGIGASTSSDVEWKSTEISYYLLSGEK